MKSKKEKVRCIGGLVLEAVMIVFILSYSFSDASGKDFSRSGALVLQETPLEQIIFQDPNSSESLVPFFTKIQIADCEFIHVLADQLGLKVAKSFSFSVARHTYNTFYKHITIHAP
jgi:hypothetical protein